MKQQSWLELFNGYELQIQYHSRRAKDVAIVLRKHAPHNLTSIVTTQLSLLNKLKNYSVQLVLFEQTYVQLSAVTFTILYSRQIPVN